MKQHSTKKRTTAGDVMIRNVLTVNHNLPAKEAAELLSSKSVSGVPVVDDDGKCVGVFSAVDFIRVVKHLTGAHEQPCACPFQVRHRRTDGTDAIICTLPAGLCAMQLYESEEREVRQVCQAPHEIVVEWQELQPELSPNDPVRRWMSSDPITVTSSATLPECANRMANARIHRLVVLDNDHHVVGLISSIDLLKAMAACND